MSALIDDADLLSRTWDFVVIGTGPGGATLGHALAQAGKSVLFCERGRHYVDRPDSLAGDWLDALIGDRAGKPTTEEMKRSGRFTGDIDDITRSTNRRIRPVLGIGSGGSSALYGMVMERLFPADFTPAKYYRGAEGANVPESWPISFKEMGRYYAKAEALYGVRGTVDPLRPEGETRSIRQPPNFTSSTAELAGNLRSKGLHPYHVPVACDYVEGCLECVGYLCPKACKIDSVAACLGPALGTNGAALLSDCEVDTLHANDGAVDAVNATWRGERVRLRGRKVVLAAGAIHTPAILLRSGGANGLANGSGQVGRNLMRHLIDYYIVHTKERYSGGPQKQIALNDFYIVDGLKMGTVQSNGRMPPASSIAAGFRDQLRNIWQPLDFIYPLFGALVEARVRKMLSGSHALVSFLEDLPYASNRIALSDDRRTLTLQYEISRFDRSRLDTFRRRIAGAIQPLRFERIRQAHENRVLGHVSGTCRFGDDPKTSVLNRDNRAHELDNLYIVDASFFPTSGGVNPSLTIVANALRVADRILSLEQRTEHAQANRGTSAGMTASRMGGQCDA